MKKPLIVASDLEGVFIPEVWIRFAEKTGIEELKVTTRDIKDYSELMNYRIAILKKNHLSVKDIENVIRGMEPFEGACDLVNWLKAKTPFVILSDTFYEFAGPFMDKMGYPTLFCHTLDIDKNGFVSGFRLRVPDSKRVAVQSFKTAGFRVMAMGDSYNDTTMLLEADNGYFFNAPRNVLNDFPQLTSLENYENIKETVLSLL